MSTTHIVTSHGRARSGRMPWPFKVAIAVGVIAVMIGMVVAQGKEGVKGPKRSAAGLPLETIKVVGESFETEIAADTPSRSKGLGGRTEIGRNEAMLFVFPVTQPLGFWMKDCDMDIDLAFMDRNGVITAVHSMKHEDPKGKDETQEQYEARLKRYDSGKDAIYAMEFQPGTLERLGLKEGQTITLDHGRMRAYLR
ncbi:MAG: DUF192 domain-containing protein [Phycisphaerae bacterium]|nr:DUF192 domain-containing protein [Phycisphaerae bacterium]